MTNPESPGFPPPAPPTPPGDAPPQPAEAAPPSPVAAAPTRPAPRLAVPSPAAAEFGLAVRTLTPRGFVTEAIIALNVLVYVAMVLKGVSPMEPKVADLITWGAGYAPRTTGGEWWRLFTSTFVHIGAIHIAMNMYVLWSGGRMVERILGNAGFLVAYVVAGFAGSFASMLWSPFVVSAGASGAVFGVYGALLGFLVRERGSIPNDVLQGLGKNALVFLGYNLMFGLSMKGIDMAAHIGGLAGGFVAGVCLAHPLTPAGAAGRWRRNLVVALVAAGAIVGGTRVVPHPIDLDAELARFDAAQGIFNDGVRQAKADQLSDEGFADLVEKKVLPPWREARASLAKATQLPPLQARIAAAVLRSAETRQEAFELFVQGARANDGKLVEAANAKQHVADEQLAPLREGAGKN